MVTHDSRGRWLGCFGIVSCIELIVSSAPRRRCDKNWTNFLTIGNNTPEGTGLVASLIYSQPLLHLCRLVLRDNSSLHNPLSWHAVMHVRLVYVVGTLYCDNCIYEGSVDSLLPWILKRFRTRWYPAIPKSSTCPVESADHLQGANDSDS